MTIALYQYDEADRIESETIHNNKEIYQLHQNQSFTTSLEADVYNFYNLSSQTVSEDLLLMIRKKIIMGYKIRRNMRDWSVNKPLPGCETYIFQCHWVNYTKGLPIYVIRPG